MVYDILILIASLSTIYIVFINIWRLSPEVVELVSKYKTIKRKDLKPQLTSCGLLREGKSEQWDGFCHLATDAEGIYVASIGMPYMHVPWNHLTNIGVKRLWLKKYTLYKIEGFPLITWCVPPKYSRHAAESLGSAHAQQGAQNGPR